MALYTTDGKINYTAARAIVDRVSAARMKRAKAACKAANLDPNSIGCQLHNALVDYSYGKPWKEVDYKMARKAAWLSKTSYRAYNVLDSLYHRKGPNGFAFNQPI